MPGDSEPLWPRSPRGPASSAVSSRPELVALSARTRPTSLAAEDLLPVDPALAELLGAPGLRRGWTIVVDGSTGSGGISLVLRLLSSPSESGAWCAMVDLPAVGVVAAEELGVALDRLFVVPAAGTRFAAVVASLLEGFDLVVARPPGSLSPRDAGRLAARAREKRAVLIVAATGKGALGGERSGSVGTRHEQPPGPASPRWPGEPDVRLEVGQASWLGIGSGSGRLVAREVEVVARRRRASPPEQQSLLLLNDPQTSKESR